MSVRIFARISCGSARMGGVGGTILGVVFRDFLLSEAHFHVLVLASWHRSVRCCLTKVSIKQPRKSIHLLLHLLSWTGLLILGVFCVLWKIEVPCLPETYTCYIIYVAESVGAQRVLAILCIHSRTWYSLGLEHCLHHTEPIECVEYAQSTQALTSSPSYHRYSQELVSTQCRQKPFRRNANSAGSSHAAIISRALREPWMWPTSVPP